MTFRKYDHVERLGHPEVRDLDIGLIHVFPKLDGTNASVWSDMDDGLNPILCCGSRNRVLSADKDNHGFHAWVHGDSPEATALRRFVRDHPHLILYGEWLVPHSLKTYRSDAWKRFWIFDVFDRDGDKYVPFQQYADLINAEAPELDVVQPLCTMEHPSENQLREVMERNTFLIEDGKGAGEGIVMKNYAWQNKFGRQPWAKMVTNEFKEKNGAAFGPRHIKGERDIAAEIVAELATEDFIRKEWAKVVNLVANDLGVVFVEPDPMIDRELTAITCAVTGIKPSEPPTVVDPDEFVAGNRHKIIPRFLGTLFYEFVQEEVRTIIKKWKNPVLDFGRLNKLLTIRAKEVMREVF